MHTLHTDLGLMSGVNPNEMQILTTFMLINKTNCAFLCISMHYIVCQYQLSSQVPYTTAKDDVIKQTTAKPPNDGQKV